MESQGECLVGAWCLCSLPLSVCMIRFLLGISQSALVARQGKAAWPGTKGLGRMEALRGTQMAPGQLILSSEKEALSQGGVCES